MIKAIFFDIDGTLLSSTDGSFADSTRFALTKLQEKGSKSLSHLEDMYAKLKNNQFEISPLMDTPV